MIGRIVLGIAQSASHSDDITVMLSVKSITMTDSESRGQNDAAVEVRNEVLNLLSQDLQEYHSLQAQVLTGPTNSSSPNSTPVNLTGTTAKGARWVGKSWPQSFEETHHFWLIIVGAVILACCSKYTCAFLLMRSQQHNDEDEALVEIWTREREKTRREQLLVLFEEFDLDNVNSVDVSPDGYVADSDLAILFADRTMARKLERLGVTAKKASIVFTIMDKDRRGIVPYNDFVDELSLYAGN